MRKKIERHFKGGANEKSPFWEHRWGFLAALEMTFNCIA